MGGMNMITVETLELEIKDCGCEQGIKNCPLPAGAGWGISQNPKELAAFLYRMHRVGVKSVLELGTGKTGGLARFMAERMGWYVTSIDTHKPRPEPKSYRFIQGNTRDVMVHEMYDLVFIDAEHSYDAVSADYRRFGDLAVQAVAFHDVNEKHPGILQFFNELSDLHGGSQRVISKDWPCGIGWIEV